MINPFLAKRRKSRKAIAKTMEVLTADSEQYQRDLSSAGGKTTSVLELRQKDILRRARAIGADIKSVDAEYRRAVREANAAYKVEVEARRAAVQNDPSRSVSAAPATEVQ